MCRIAEFNKNLADIQKKYPNLPVYFSVDPDTVPYGAQFGSYIGIPGYVRVRNFTCDDEGRLFFDDEVNSEFIFNWMEKENIKDPEHLPWERAIFVNASV